LRDEIKLPAAKVGELGVKKSETIGRYMEVKKKEQLTSFSLYLLVLVSRRGIYTTVYM
jgi:hypothetical protein